MRYQTTACALAVMAGAASAQTIGSRSPAAEEIATLYISSFVNLDTGAVRQLNDRLRPLYDAGEDAVDAKEIEAMEPANIAGTADRLKEDAQVKNARLHSAIDGFSQSLWGALKRSKCFVTGSTVKHNEYSKGMITVVKYECLVSDVSPRVATITKIHGKFDPNKSGRSVDYFNQLANAYNTAPLTQRFCSSFNLYSTSNPDLWYTGGPGDVTNTVLTWLVLAYRPRTLMPGIFQPCQPAA